MNIEHISDEKIYLNKDLPCATETCQLDSPALSGHLTHIEPESSGFRNPAPCGNDNPIETELYLNENLEQYQTMNIEPENSKHACRVS